MRGTADISPDRHLLQYLQSQQACSAAALDDEFDDGVSLVVAHSRAELPSVVTLSCWHSLPFAAIRMHIMRAVAAGTCGDDLLQCPVGGCHHVLFEWEIKVCLQLCLRCCERLTAHHCLLLLCLLPAPGDSVSGGV